MIEARCDGEQRKSRLTSGWEDMNKEVFGLMAGPSRRGVELSFVITCKRLRSDKSMPN